MIFKLQPTAYRQRLNQEVERNKLHLSSTSRERWNETTTTTTKYNINKKQNNFATTHTAYRQHLTREVTNNNCMSLPVTQCNNDNQQLAHQKSRAPHTIADLLLASRVSYKRDKNRHI
jgi:hypothetical protein